MKRFQALLPAITLFVALAAPVFGGNIETPGITPPPPRPPDTSLTLTVLAVQWLVDLIL